MKGNNESSLVIWSVQFSCVTNENIVVNHAVTFECTPYLSGQVNYKDLLNHQLLKVKNHLNKIKLKICSK